MEVLMTIVAGILITIGTYLVLSKTFLHVILGLSLFTHGTHLILLTMGGLKKGVAPLLGEEATSFTDPLPQALILTSIVINFALTAYFLVLAYRTYRETGTDDLEELKGGEHE